MEVPLSQDPGKDDFTVNKVLLDLVSTRLNITSNEMDILASDVTIVRKSFDGRWKKDGQPKFGNKYFRNSLTILQT